MSNLVKQGLALRDAVPQEEQETFAKIVISTPLSIIVPTFRECENIPRLIERVRALKEAHDISLELIFMDDQSRDGSVEVVAATGLDWVRILERDGERGLSPAVIDGFRLARNPVLVCMDCDLSHPPEKIPQLILALSSGQQFVIGSRYVPGGSTDDDWGFLRWLNSRIATLMARPLTSARDPMSGFFALRRADFEKARELNPVGYKIGLELIVKCGFENVAEVPIHFADRVYGESKLTLKEQLKYLQHIRRLYIHEFGNAMHFLQFLVVGASGTAVNLLVLSAILLTGLPEAVSLAGGIAVSLVTNFLLNRRFTFSYARDRNPWKQFAGFVGASAVGLAVNYGVALYLVSAVLPERPTSVYFAALAGVASGMLFNFLGNRYLVFRKRYIRR
ncbi:glycosyltransferase [Allorhizobium sp. NPDC080224]|uniref:glycosyltransferase n=1 Tax=Allorhizobium sp. NPDC080224 TaxID=3390547 RepID=UPI003CFFF833